jgi:hypothetical protein
MRSCGCGPPTAGRMRTTSTAACRFYLPDGHGLEPLEDWAGQRPPGVHEPSIHWSSSKAAGRTGT